MFVAIRERNAITTVIILRRIHNNFLFKFGWDGPGRSYFCAIITCVLSNCVNTPLPGSIGVPGSSTLLFVLIRIISSTLEKTAIAGVTIMSILTLLQKRPYRCTRCKRRITVTEDKQYDCWCKKCFIKRLKKHVNFPVSKSWIQLLDAPNFSEIYPIYLAKRRKEIEGSN